MEMNLPTESFEQESDETKNDIDGSREAIRFALDDLGRELPEYQRVRDYIVRTAPLPRTATRKIKRFELQKEIAADRADNGRQPTDDNTFALTKKDREMLATKIGQTLVEAIRQHARDATTIHPAMTLEIDLGLDSLARAEVFASLEQAFEIEFEADSAADTSQPAVSNTVSPNFFTRLS